MKLAMSLFALCFLVLNASCAKKDSGHSSVKIQFDQNLFKNQVGDLEKVSSSSAADGTPAWGVSDPSSLAQINCWGVFVGGPDDFLQSQKCTNSTDEVIMKFGLRAGFFPLNEAGEVFVPSGEDRVFYLAGMASADGQCALGFDSNPDINFSNYSAPFIIGQVTADLTKAEEVISIPLIESFAESNRIKDCDFIPTTSDPMITPLSLNVTFPETKRSTFVADNDLARTVSFSYTGASVQCSEDGGTSFSACTSSTSFVWQQANMSQAHHIRVFDETGTYTEEVFTPDVVYPGLNFVTCGPGNSLSGTTTFDDGKVTAALATSGNVLCFDNGVTVTDGTATKIAVSQSNLTFIARHGDTATINQTADDNIFSLTSGADGVKIVGLTMTSGATSGTAHGISTSSVQGLELEDIHLTMTAASSLADGVYLNASGSTTAVSILGIFVQNDKRMALRTNTASSANVKSSRFSSNSSIGVYHAGGGQVVVEDSVIHSRDNYPARVFTSAQLTVNDSYILDGSGMGVTVVGMDSSFNAFLTLNNNKIVRLNENTAMFGAAIQMDPANSTTTAEENLVTVSNGNYFCAQDHTSVYFTAMTVGTLGASSAWVNDNQANGAGADLTSETCPTEIQSDLTALGF